MKNLTKKYHGGYKIAKGIGCSPLDYTKIVGFLYLIDAPKGKNEKGVLTYCLNEKQVKFLKTALKKIKKGIKNEK